MIRPIILASLLINLTAQAHITADKAVPVLTSLKLLEQLNIPALSHDRSIDVAYALLSPQDQERLLAANHRAGKCAGFEALEHGQAPFLAIEAQNGAREIARLKDLLAKDRAIPSLNTLMKGSVLEKRPEIETAVAALKSENIESTVVWLSAFPDRYNKSSTPNRHVVEMENKLKDLMKDYKFPFTIEQITHRSTRQNSLRVHLEGRLRPSEIIALGGHLDSINQGWSGGGDAAPGADDNASGSASLMEALRVLILQGQPERSVEFFWYAGEESGLLGSAEIAKLYKSQNKDVVAVLQLDMTMFPGDGELVINNISDYTSQWLRTYLVNINDLYIGARLIDGECGYGCSDHASWFRQGYSTLMPFEASLARSNKNIHTTRDIVSPQTSFTHALGFSKIALVLAMDLANSQIRAPQ